MLRTTTFLEFQKRMEILMCGKKLLSIKHVEAGLKLCIEDGRKVCFWTDNWV